MGARTGASGCAVQSKKEPPRNRTGESFLIQLFGPRCILSHVVPGCFPQRIARSLPFPRYRCHASASVLLSARSRNFFRIRVTGLHFRFHCRRPRFQTTVRFLAFLCFDEPGRFVQPSASSTPVFYRVFPSAALAFCRAVIKVEFSVGPFQKVVHWSALRSGDLSAFHTKDVFHIVVPPDMWIFGSASSSVGFPVMADFPVRGFSLCPCCPALKLTHWSEPSLFCVLITFHESYFRSVPIL